jgi:hypothetical protein
MSIRKLMVYGYNRLAFLGGFYWGFWGLYLTHKPLSL